MAQTESVFNFHTTMSGCEYAEQIEQRVKEEEREFSGKKQSGQQLDETHETEGRISVFLSHSSRDKPLARQIAHDLLMANIDVWLDEWKILVGDSITQCIQRGLEETDFIAVLLTKHSVESGWVEKEWQSQIGREASTRQVFILPLKADDCIIPVLLRDKNYADFQGEYADAIKRLIEAVNGHASRRKSAQV